MQFKNPYAFIFIEQILPIIHWLMTITVVRYHPKEYGIYLVVPEGLKGKILRNHATYERRWEAFVREEGTQISGVPFKVELTCHSKS